MGTKLLRCLHCGAYIAEIVEKEPPEPVKDDPRDKPVDDHAWSARVQNCLKNEHILTFRQLCARSRAELLRVPNFGRLSLAEVEEALREYGLKLGDKGNADDLPRD